MSSQPDTITPKAVPLSHAGTAHGRGQRDSRKLIVALFLAFAVSAVIALFVWAPQFLAPEPMVDAADVGTPNASAGNDTANSRPEANARPNTPPPFEALRREQARTEAQDELARFVELEIELRDTLQVDGWADAALADAKDLAHGGDESFVAERYAQAIEKYRAAADALAALIAEGTTRFETALAQAAQAVRGRDPDAADDWLAQARLIKPENAQLLALAARAGHLPEIINLLRQAHNQELAGAWGDAIATYAQIRALDPATQGLDQALAKARQQRSAQRLQSFLSTGFAQLSNGRLNEAQSSFNKALALDPQNGAALGGQQQVEEQRLVDKIEHLQRQAEHAAAGEDWPAATAAYQAILAVDANIQFARAGLAEASVQSATIAALKAIAAQPESLSSDRRYAEAHATLSQAKAIEPRGAILNDSITAVAALLDAHAIPVPVVLQSDNATDVLLSNVGPLGKFSEVRLDLRPGAYTLVGSRDGCRDVRTTFTVRTNMPPVDIRCQEVLAR